MDLTVDLGQIVAFILVNEKNITGKNAVERIVDEKLLSSGDGKINLITVMYVHIHGLFVIIQMGKGKILILDTAFNTAFTGRTGFHKLLTSYD